MVPASHEPNEVGAVEERTEVVTPRVTDDNRLLHGASHCGTPLTRDLRDGSWIARLERHIRAFSGCSGGLTMWISGEKQNAINPSDKERERIMIADKIFKKNALFLIRFILWLGVSFSIIYNHVVA